MTEAAATDRLRAISPGAVATAAAYGVLGAILLVTRFAGLDRSLWHDEILTVSEFVREGPGEILAGAYIPNNHELFSLLGWATSSSLGESEVALRLWSVVPFVVGVALVTAWLHVRVGALSGALFLFFATASPLLLDITRQARGYGLAFLAMSVLVLAALEAERTGRSAAIAAFCTAGVAGTWTLPHFGIAFLATGAVLLAVREIRQPVGVGLVASLFAIVVWWAPHVGDLTSSSGQDYGLAIATRWLLTAPFDQVLVPAFVWIDGTVPVPGLVWLPVVGLALVLSASSPLLRSPAQAAILASGVVASILVFWAARIELAPRFLSFLLVPLLMLVATGTASILARFTERPPLARTVLALAAVALVAARFATTAPDVLGAPREAHEAAAQAIVRLAPPESRVVANMHNPIDLDFYLDMPVTAVEGADVVPAVCNSEESVVYVHQPFVVATVDVPCLSRPGVERYRFEQYTRGGEISVWIVPPRR